MKGQKIILGTDGLLFLCPLYSIKFKEEIQIFPISRIDMLTRNEDEKDKDRCVVRSLVVKAIKDAARSSKTNPRAFYDQIENEFLRGLLECDLEIRRNISETISDILDDLKRTVENDEISLIDLCNRYGTQVVLVRIILSKLFEDIWQNRWHPKINSLIGVNARNFLGLQTQELADYCYVDEATMGLVEHLRDYDPVRNINNRSVFHKYYEEQDEITRFVSRSYRSLFYNVIAKLDEEK
jgi:hypothetical protein